LVSFNSFADEMLDDANISSLPSTEERRMIKDLSEECMFGLIGNVWLRYPSTTKQQIKDHLEIWSVLKGERIRYGRWKERVKKIMIGHKIHKYCETCNLTAKEKHKHDLKCHSGSCKDKTTSWGQYLTFNIEDQLRNVLQGKCNISTGLKVYRT
jgi:hypothetical protein